MSSQTKDTIYIDIDDEITSIIEKLQGSPHKIVALVLPKRATMLQSIVNMKLLKKSGDSAKKNLVLITSETGILPLAGAVGLHVAKTLQSKPEIPPPPKTSSEADENIEDAGDVDIDPNKPIGHLAGLPDEKDAEETIEVDEMDEEASANAQTKPKAKKKDRKLKVPNFNKFRTRLFLGIAGFILLIIGWYLAAAVLPSAHITVQTDTASITSDVLFTARPGLNELDSEQSLLPAVKEEVKKVESEKVAATGQKDIGQKATGQVTFSIPCANVSGSPPTIPAGTGTSTGNLTYITQKSTSLSDAKFNPCRFEGIADVTAQNSGEQYNLAANQTFTVSGNSNVTGKNGAAISGGTSQIVKVVKQEDVDSAKTKAIERGQEIAKKELTDKLMANNYYAIGESFIPGATEVTSTPKVGEEASEVTVQSTVTYTMVGIKEDDLKKLVEEDVKDDIDSSKQTVLDHGLVTAVFRLLSNEANGDVRLSVQSLVVAGPQLNESDLKNEIKGKSKTETTEIIKNRPGIRDVNIDYSPFWVFSTPRKEGKIKFTFENSNETNNTDASNEGE